MTIMDWVRNRIVEPTSWIAIGVGSIILSMIMPSWAMWFLCIAGATVVAGVIMKEKAE